MICPVVASGVTSVSVPPLFAIIYEVTPLSSVTVGVSQTKVCAAPNNSTLANTGAPVSAPPSSEASQAAEKSTSVRVFPKISEPPALLFLLKIKCICTSDDG